MITNPPRTISRSVNRQDWFADRTWTTSGCRLATKSSSSNSNGSSTQHLQDLHQHDERILYYPQTAEDVAAVLQQQQGRPVAVISGGGESSNVATGAVLDTHDDDVCIIDLSEMNGIEFNKDDGKYGTVRVGAGVVLRNLCYALQQHHAALPLAAGPTVGVAGYVLNGGFSGPFSRRLGLLGQRCTALTMVDAQGIIHHLKRSDEHPGQEDDTTGLLFQQMLGAGSALGVVTDLTFELAPETILQTAQQLVVACETLEQATSLVRRALDFQRMFVFGDEQATTTMEIVMTASRAVAFTIVFYDTFAGSTSDFVKPLYEMVTELGLHVAKEVTWDNWFDVASSSWATLEGMKGSPLVWIQSTCGTAETPSDAVCDFVATTWMGQAPLEQADRSFLVARTLGGVVSKLPAIPTGNCVSTFFCHSVLLYDGANKTNDYHKAVVSSLQSTLDAASAMVSDDDHLVVNMSGTNSQPDLTSHIPKGDVIFGSESNYRSIQESKKRIDPTNRFRYHPYATIL